ncbi:lysostaphin resistance A-like protein [Bacteroidota bacterium]
MVPASKSSKHVIYLEAALCSLGFIVFSYFIHHGFPFVIISFIGLAFPALIMSRQFNSPADISQVFGLLLSRKKSWYLLVGLQLGLIYSIAYRNVTDVPMFPKYLTWFAITASLIGAAEELIFRGFFQEYFKRINTGFAVLFATSLHTAYKCFLFLSPVHTIEVNIQLLFIFTFAAGLFLGLLKEFSKSIIPAIIAHVIFDILVYGECLQPPWWVW